MIGKTMTEAEVARDLHTVLEKVIQGVEVIIEKDSWPVTVIKAPVVNGPNISEVIAALEGSGQCCQAAERRLLVLGNVSRAERC